MTFKYIRVIIYNKEYEITENKVKLEKVGYLIADNEIIPFITNTRETHIKSLATEEVAPINLINGDKTCAGDHQNNFVKKLLDSQSIRVVENYVNLMYDFDSEIDSLLSFVSFKDCVFDNIARDILLMGKCENSNKRLNKKHKKSPCIGRKMAYLSTVVGRLRLLVHYEYMRHAHEKLPNPKK